MIERFRTLEKELIYQIMIMGLPVTYQTITDPFFKIDCLSPKRILYFEMDADARQSLKWFTFIDHSKYNKWAFPNTFCRKGVISHSVWYEDW